MAKAKSPNSTGRSSGRSSGGFARLFAWSLVLVVGAAMLGAVVYRETITGYADVSAAYSARVACSCRFVAGRSLEDCEKDKLGGMELVTLADDAEAKSVTARFPLVTSHTATHREGYGCVLEPWSE